MINSMKALTIFFFAGIFMCLPTCKKSDDPIVDVPVEPIDTIISQPVDPHIIGLGKVSVLKNGQKWDVPFNAWFSLLEGTFLIATRQVYANGVTQSFQLDDIPCKPGKYSFEFWPSVASLYPNKIPNGSFGMMFEVDQPIGNFFLDTLRNDHYIEVIAYDTLTKIVEGRFQMFTKKKPNAGWQPSGVVVPDSIAFTEGKFRMEVKKF